MIQKCVDILNRHNPCGTQIPRVKEVRGLGLLNAVEVDCSGGWVGVMIASRYCVAYGG